VETISFVDWFAISTPHAIMGLAVSWIVIFLIIRPEIKTFPATRNQFTGSLKSMHGENATRGNTGSGHLIGCNVFG
jgi:di/tricarboxylate transporter